MLKIQIRPARRISKGLVRYFVAGTVLFSTVGTCAGQEEGPRRTLRFDQSVPTQANDAGIRQWVGTELHKRLKLQPSDSLKVMGPPRRLGAWSVYDIAQSAMGVPVVHRESRLVMNSRGQPHRLLGSHEGFPSPPSSSPVLDLTHALASSRTVGNEALASRIVYWPAQTSLTLSYEVDGLFGDRMGGVERVYIDARTGSILERLPLLYRARDRRIYDFQSACRSAGVRRPMGGRSAIRLLSITMRRHLKRDEGSTLSGDAQVDQTFELLAQFYEFLETVLEMDSFDDDGAPIKSVMNIRFHRDKLYLPQCVGDDFNAAWNDVIQSALFPVGIAHFPEIIGHEFGHAIISSGSRLIYKHEPGALNEAISDAIGVAFHSWIKTGGKLDSELPDEIWKMRATGRVARDFRNPRLVNNLPNHYSDYRWVRDDNGGVHVNSSIINQGFYLLVVGGRHPDQRNGPEVPGIGISKAIKIFGRAGFNLLTRNANFVDARYAFALAAEMLFGANSEEWVATHTAMDAIGIPGYWDRPPEPVAVPEAPAINDEESDSSDPLPQEPIPEEPEVSTERTPSPNKEEHGETTDESEQVREEPKRPLEQGENPMPRSPSRGTPERVPESTRFPGPRPPEPPRPPIDSQPSPQPRSPTDEPNRSPRPAVLALGGILLLLLALALLIIRSKVRHATGTDVSQSDPSLDTSEGPVGAGEVERTLLGTLEAFDGSTSIPLNRDLLVSEEGLVIGRAAELCHVEIRDPRISRRHVRCRLFRGQLWIEDLHSTAGTHVDGIRLEPFKPVQVSTSQELRIGTKSYRLSPLIHNSSR